jgi:hypothetical protein
MVNADLRMSCGSLWPPTPLFCSLMAWTQHVASTDWPQCNGCRAPGLVQHWGCAGGQHKPRVGDDQKNLPAATKHTGQFAM